MIKLRAENVIYFVTVCGFFIGLMFCVVNMEDPFDILFYTLEITLFFYLLAHVAIMNFMDIENLGKKIFDHKEYEDVSSYFINELEAREDVMENLIQVSPPKKAKHAKRKKKVQGQTADGQKAA